MEVIEKYKIKKNYPCQAKKAQGHWEYQFSRRKKIQLNISKNQ